MPSFVLTDLACDLSVDAFHLGPEALGLPLAPGWSITKQTLRGGRREGVELVRIDNGLLSLAVVPSRGMNLWRGSCQGIRLGWDSPVRDGPVHPSLVNLADIGGLGWLDGFDELLARCGLAHNGAPFEEGGILHPLHGRISNRPAHHVAVHVDERPPHALVIEGHVDEARLFGPRLRLSTRLTTEPGSSRATLEDTVTNLGDRPQEFQLLYHWNLGPPLLEEGSRLVAAFEEVVPRTPHAAEDVDRHDVYGPPTPGLAERVYFYRLRGQGPAGETLALLRNAAGDRGFALRFRTAELPCFTLWKNTAGLSEGYVTGLEPATNYPNPRPFEQSQGRVPVLEPGASWTARTVIEVATSAEGVSALEREVATCQGGVTPNVRREPCLPYAPPAG